MFDQIASSILKDFVQPSPQNPSQVTISIPRSHPKFEALMRLAKALATRETQPSGLVVEHLFQPGAVDEFLDALRALDVDVDRIKETLAAAQTPSIDPKKMFGRLLPMAPMIKHFIRNK